MFKFDEVVGCTTDCERIDWTKVLIIEETTLKSINADAKGYKSALEELVKAQADLNGTSKKLNTALDSNSDLQQELRDVEVPPWYKSPPLWAAVGLIVGVLSTTSIILSIQKNQ